MAVIKPTLTLVSNASAATTDPGPLSVALTLSATDSLTVDEVASGIYTFDDATSHTTIFDGSSFGADGLGGTVGGYIYLKNTSTSATVYIGIVADGGSASDIDASGDAARLFTLKAQEFAWLPYDYTMDVTADSDGAATLEWWRFDRG